MIRLAWSGTIAIAVALGLLAHPIRATGLDGLSWTEQKCVLYQSAWDVALESVGSDGISEAFISQNNAFVATGCIDKGNVCPKSAQELEMANMLTLMTMNEGMASTFVPFSCREADDASE